MFQEQGSKRRRTESPHSADMMEGGNEDSIMPGLRVQDNPEHGMKLLHGLNLLKRDKVLCDVTLIAEG